MAVVCPAPGRSFKGTRARIQSTITDIGKPETTDTVNHSSHSQQWHRPDILTHSPSQPLAAHTSHTLAHSSGTEGKYSCGTAAVPSREGWVTAPAKVDSGQVPALALWRVCWRLQGKMVHQHTPTNKWQSVVTLALKRVLCTTQSEQPAPTCSRLHGPQQHGPQQHGRHSDYLHGH